MTEVFSWREAPAADFAVIGDPVAHSRSPRMHDAAYRTLGLPYRYVAIHVPPDEASLALDHLAALGYRGVNATVPHKEAALEWAREVEPLARRARAVNTLRMEDRAGINTDAPGFLQTLLGFGFGISDFRVTVDPTQPTKTNRALILGAGGSARALALALVEAGWDVRLHNRTFARAEALAAEVGARALEVPDPEGASLILNATSASLHGVEPEVRWDRAEPGCLAYDLAYGDSPFLRSASGVNLRTLDGLPLLVAQGALAFEWWLGMPAPRETMREAIR